jgi:hypothetical protein
MQRKVKPWITRLSTVVLLIILILTSVASFAALVLAAESTPSFLFKWGSHGTGNGKFDHPRGIAIDSLGNIYVADTGNNRIQKFDSSGNFLVKWGSNGTGNGKFDTPRGVAVDSSGNVYVADTGNDRIQKFDSGGNFLAKWGSHGIGNGKLDHPSDVAVDSSGNVYVADTRNDRIQKFDSSKNFLAKWGTSGSLDGEFDHPRSVAVSSSGNIYVTDTTNERIQVFGYPSVITSVGPSSGNQGQTLINVTITGTNLAGATAVSFGNDIIVNINTDNATQITANITIAAGATPGTRDVSVTTLAGTGTLPNGFTVLQSTQIVNTATGTGTATFTTSNGSITALTAANSTLCGALPGVIFPYGFFSFNITNLNPGATAIITITLPSNMPAGTQYRKCINGQWVNCTSLLGHNDGDNILTLTITDGGLGDADGLANGTIVDPGGPALLISTPEKPSVSPSMLRQLNPAQMSIRYLNVNPQQAASNQPLTISTNVVNTGDEAGNLNITLKINGQAEQTKMVSVGPQASQPVKFTVTKAQPGTYTIDIGGQKGSFIINGAGSSTGSTSASGGMIAVIIFGVLAVIVVAILLLARRPA